MSRPATTAPTPETITIRVPMTFAKRGGRKLMVTPAGTRPLAPPRARIDSALVKAIARAFRWKDMLESGAFESIVELARTEKINPSYLCRILRLTLLAPDIVDRILNGDQPVSIQLPDLLRPFPVSWQAQRERFGLTPNRQPR
jgi:hypothetical protein